MSKTHVQVSRSNVAGARPVAASQPTGSLYVNFPDEQLGVIDPAGNPVDLIPKTLGDLIPPGATTAPLLSQDAGNASILGTDGLIYTPASQGGALPARLGPAWNGVLDLNLATETGWFHTWDGANRPTALQGWFVYTNNIDTNFLRQTAFGYMSATAGDTLTYQRDRQGGAWGAWYKLQTSQAEQDARYALPARLGANAVTVTDWNNALENGWYFCSTGTNAPVGDWCVGRVEAINSANVTQTVHAYAIDGSGNTYTYRRSRTNNVWEAWYKLQLSQAEQDARYALPARLGAKALYYTDFNLMLDNGWYSGWEAANRPDTSVQAWLCFVESGEPGYTTQTAHGYGVDGSSNTVTYRRSLNANVWSAWYKLQLSQAEQDARYALVGHTHPVVRSIDANDSSAGLRITQQGTGWSLLVEDAVSPDDTPFAVTATGNVLVGSRGPVNTVRPNGFDSTPQLQVNGLGVGGITMSIAAHNNDDQPPSLIFSKSNASTVGVHRLVTQGEQLGAVQFNASNGTDFMRAAMIVGVAEGTPTASGIPARIEFRVWDGVQAVYNEAMRLNNKGALAFNGAKFGAAGQALLSSGNAAAPVWGTNLYVMEEDVAALKQRALDLEKRVEELTARLTTLEAPATTAN